MLNYKSNISNNLFSFITFFFVLHESNDTNVLTVIKKKKNI